MGEGNNTADSGQATIARLNELERAVEEIQHLRRKQLGINIGSILVITLISVVFAFQMYDYAKNFNNQELLSELQSNARIIASSRDAKLFAEDLQKAFVPLYKDALIANATSRMPEIRQQSLAVVDRLEKYLHNDMKDKLEAELTRSLDDFEAQLVRRYPDLSPDKVSVVFEEGKAHFNEQVCNNIEKRLSQTIEELAALKETFNLLKNDPEYKALKKTELDLIKAKLIETMLELCIYNINEEKGAQSAGGAK